MYLGYEREQNLANAFSIGQDFTGHHPHALVLLIDGIYTTAANTKSIVNTLHQSSISV